MINNMFIIINLSVEFVNAYKTPPVNRGVFDFG
jgi:hypothetical protein